MATSTASTDGTRPGTSPPAPGLDPLGVATSSAGLALVTYGLIEAGDEGWGAAWTLVPLFAGLAVLVTFSLWERWLGQRLDGRPLLPPDLFRSSGFTWGRVLMTTVAMAMFGVLFAVPQYFQGVLGTDAMGSGLRLLPLMGGLLVGAVPADRVAARIGARVTVAVGFAMLAAGLLGGAATRGVRARASLRPGWPWSGPAWGWGWPRRPLRRSAS
jgi:MFS transporter, DHA2 family, multidrug resistance protein